MNITWAEAGGAGMMTERRDEIGYVRRGRREYVGEKIRGGEMLVLLCTVKIDPEI